MVQAFRYEKRTGEYIYKPVTKLFFAKNCSSMISGRCWHKTKLVTIMSFEMNRYPGQDLFKGAFALNL